MPISDNVQDPFSCKCENEKGVENVNNPMPACNGGGGALVKAALVGRVTEVQELLRCPNIDINHVYNHKYGETALLTAAFKGHSNVVKLLAKP